MGSDAVPPQEAVAGREQHGAGAIQRRVQRRKDGVVDQLWLRPASCKLCIANFRRSLLTAFLSGWRAYAAGVVLRRFAKANAKANSTAVNPPRTATASHTGNCVAEPG